HAIAPRGRNLLRAIPPCQPCGPRARMGPRAGTPPVPVLAIALPRRGLGRRRKNAGRRWRRADPDPHGGHPPTTLRQMFLDSVARCRKPAHFMRRLPDTAGHGRWESLSSERARADVESLALGLAALGVRRGDRVALLSENRYEWAVSDLASLGQGAVTVPIYPTLTAPH